MKITVTSKMTGETREITKKGDKRSLNRYSKYFGTSREGSHPMDRDR